MTEHKGLKFTTPTFDVTRRTILQGSAGLALGLAGSQTMGRRTFAASPSKTQINVALGFLGMGRHAGYYVAQAKGYYAEGGLEVSLKPSNGNTISFQMLTTGQVQFTNSDIPAMMQLQGKLPEPQMRSVAVIYNDSPMTCFFFKDRGISTPKDLEGKTIVDSPGSVGTALFPIFAKANNIDASKVNWKSASAAAKVGLLLQGQVDAVMLFLIGKPGVDRSLPPGRELAYFNYGEYGVNTYGDGIIATDKFIKDNPAIVKSFVRATMKGYQDAMADPKSAVETMGKTVVELNQDDAVKEIQILRELAFGPYQKEHGLGFQDPSKIKASYDSVINELETPIARPYQDFFTNEAL